MDWIDQEKLRRDDGETRSLTQDQHAAVNGRYPGTTLECCCVCDEPTGKAGAGEDSLFAENGDGPYCDNCWDWDTEAPRLEAQEEG